MAGRNNSNLGNLVSLFRLSLGEREIHSNRSDDGHRLVIQQRRLVAPLLHSIDCSLNQQRVARNDLEVIDCSFFADFSFQNDDTLDACLFRKRRVDRLNLRDQVRRNNISSNTDALGRRRWWGWRRRWGWCGIFLGLQHASQNAGQDAGTRATDDSDSWRGRGFHDLCNFFRNFGWRNDRAWIHLHLFNDNRLYRSNFRWWWWWWRRRWWRS
jgi:hypothetical protein